MENREHCEKGKEGSSLNWPTAASAPPHMPCTYAGGAGEAVEALKFHSEQTYCEGESGKLLENH